ncbi:MAG: hypothetical protein HY809_03870 [Nitrospirae bacterium]|nr:hypothetical protein [Nitrospirota bacterium]
MSKNSGSEWDLIFNGNGNMEYSVFSAAVAPHDEELIFLGTGTGLFKTDDGGMKWAKVLSSKPEDYVSAISVNHLNPDVIYAAAGKEIFRSTDSGVTWKVIYSSGILPSAGEDEAGVFSENAPDETLIDIRDWKKIRAISLTPADADVVYAATSRGLIKSVDKGETWNDISGYGLINDIRSVVANPADADVIYVAAKGGVFISSKISGRWENLYKGLASSEINYLAIDSRNDNDAFTLWAATENGLYKSRFVSGSDSGKAGNMKAECYLDYFDNEPSIHDIQEAAVRYAEVHPEKISGWRKSAARKAWLPDLRVDFGEGKDWQSSTYFYSTSSEKYKDDDLTNGRDKNWSVSLTWNLGDMIWNADQTSIDTRSRLMVQLRDEVLNDVTRLYYERRRLQLEMLIRPPQDMWEKIEKELRLEELTADIDALTDYSLSKNRTSVDAKNKQQNCLDGESE